MSGAEPKKPLWARCGSCGHCWPALYAPMSLAIAALLMQRAACPACGESKSIFVAQQRDGVLREDA